MAMIDYGAIAFKNGKLISTDFFTPMETTCGFSDYDNVLPGCESSFDGNYFVVLGNKNLLIGFYKTGMYWWSSEYKKLKYEWFGSTCYSKWKYWQDILDFTTEVTVKRRHGYYVATFTLDGDKYKVYFGYGVDLDWYKKTHLVNYYRTCPKYLINKLIRNIKNYFYDLKYR